METHEARQRAVVRVLIESVVIVGSILLAFAIDASWDCFQQGREEQRLLENLREEFVETRTILSEAAAFHGRRMEAALRVAEFARTTVSSDSPDLMPDVIYTYLHFGSYYPKVGVLDGALASGHLDLISNDLLRSRLAGWPHNWTEYAEQNELISHLVLDSRTHIVNSLAISASVIAESRRRRGEPQDSFDLVDIPSDAVEQFLGSDRAKNYAALRFEYESLALRDATALLAVVEDLLRLIGSEID